MAQIVIGLALNDFLGNAQARHTIPGPGSNAYHMIAGADRTTFLVSPGVYDCAILCVLLPARAPGGTVMGQHRTLGCRAMAHYNNFNGPKLNDLTTLFNRMKNAYGAADNDFVVTIAHHSGARGGYYNALANLVGQVLPGLQQITRRTYGVLIPNQRGLNPITVYFAADGNVEGSQP